MMEEIAEFLRKFIKAYWGLSEENFFGQLSDKEFDARLAKFNKEYVGYSDGLEIVRTTKKEREENREQWANFPDRKEPIPLLIAAYQVGPTVVWRGFASNSPTPESYLGFESVYEIKQVKKQLKITAELTRCAECRGRGVVKKRNCTNCDGSGYRTSQGESTAAGKAENVLRLERPTQPDDAAFYDEFT